MLRPNRENPLALTKIGALPERSSRRVRAAENLPANPSNLARKTLR